MIHNLYYLPLANKRGIYPLRDLILRKYCNILCPTSIYICIVSHGRMRLIRIG
jgi:hypothetical protein